MPSDSAAEGEDARALIERQVRQLTRVADDLFDAARVTRGRLPLHRERVELAAVVRQGIEFARPAIDGGRHRLSVRMPSGSCWLEGDPGRLAQAIGHLLDNAARHAGRSRDIALIAERDGSDVRVRVRDQGVGIPPEHLPSIFEMFAHASTARGGAGGLGIGLSLVRGIVELHGGSVSATSRGVGHGSEFTIRLPALREAPVAASLPERPAGVSPVPVVRTHGRRILVVDDNRDAVDGLVLLLRKLGHEVHPAHDGLECVRKAAELRPEIVLLDVGLPVMNGYEAARYIRQQPWGRSMEIIGISGWGQPEDKRRAVEAGFDEHLTKPVDLAQLQRVLESPGVHARRGGQDAGAVGSQ